jgi:hypothetical protein
MERDSGRELEPVLTALPHNTLLVRVRDLNPAIVECHICARSPRSWRRDRELPLGLVGRLVFVEAVQGERFLDERLGRLGYFSLPVESRLALHISSKSR